MLITISINLVIFLISLVTTSSKRILRKVLLGEPSAGWSFFLFVDYGKINQPYLEDGENMKNHAQTIINVCLAIFVATTIYNTNQLNDRIDRLNAIVDSLAIQVTYLLENSKD